MWIAVDFETTGLLLHPEIAAARQPRPIEFAAVRSDGQEGVWLFDPQQPIGPEITKITGLTNDDLRGAPLFAKQWPEIAEFLSGAEIWAHNARFDRGILAAALEREGKWMPQQQWRCTVEEFLPDWGRRAHLFELYEWLFGEPLAQEHRALSDTRALAAIVRELKQCDGG